MRLAFSTLLSSTLALLLASTAVIAAPQPYLTVYGEPARVSNSRPSITT